MPTAQQDTQTAIRFEWLEDWEVGSHIHEYGADAYPEEPDTCEYVLMYVTMPCGHEEVRGSLGCIDDADDAYRRQIESELAADAAVTSDTVAASAAAIERMERVAGLG